ncbi:helix-turn-helix transcriptional regulator [Butyrivibrio sp. FC2001]|uniref:helix-turn-helix transcriptional regulator n=1 Tax=Butyrivibrio sp. FC2001 TaxID=1280671 RepID=UPI00047B1BA8|nr:helix-turn-helix transcriptional regulator [Butyrivibrio sp. FC2001]
MNIGNKIKALRLKSSTTQEALADALGVSSQSISKWENNVCAPDISLLPSISEFFGVTIDELFDLSPTMTQFSSRYNLRLIIYSCILSFFPGLFNIFRDIYKPHLVQSHIIFETMIL